ncbi:DNA-directed RNA polymerase sigma-70 factor [Gluconacetobacter liquefaciens]|uniref:RNA polymerase sigma-70 factor (ECF subfamily) n=1 Tax=Gluconacetobacter liquefaciens TaxID=89584 RepID=A0A370FXA1_GLULI|nr:sigma-70 family RNA polymerase sigma factor [Gluconacetobacter liquefaciens]MBB2188251.1 sigma-70 family RNA polymerase sigma factor [Gluconacetobacter liquefaciens]RDI34107.1 RNA polymerase sigma-70 factor (ECF subfamily) [Gluconacetobacter liquefaciens]GBR02980.1 RNA polymerase sigma-24 factor [Gluconacetobacter liquefaciens NRIC 0522]GEB39077.1 DNA-directed RNA polymerase sigma-70 factor [Gluconacetobacter liquefaciens]
MQDNIAVLTDLISAERQKLLNVIQRIVGNPEAAEDAVQSLFEKIRRIENAAEIVNPRAFLYRLASNLAIDHARQAKRREEIQSDIHDLLWIEDDTPSPERTLFARHELEEIEKAVAALPEPMKTVFVLNRFHGVPQKEIAARMGRSIALVSRYICRALDIISSSRTG